MDEITIISHVVKNELDDAPVPHILLQVRADMWQQHSFNDCFAVQPR